MSRLENVSNENIAYLLLLFMPGFLFMKINNLLIASNDNDFSKKWYDAIAYGVIFSGVTYTIYLMLGAYLPVYIFPITGMIIAPLVLPFILKKIRSMPFFHKYILRPEVSAWDYIFSSRQSYWIILHLKNGNNVAGVYSAKSFTSAFPHKQDIYLEELWQLDNNQKFLTKIPRSAGLWISVDEISSIEFFDYEEENN